MTPPFKEAKERFEKHKEECRAFLSENYANETSYFKMWETFLEKELTTAYTAGRLAALKEVEEKIKAQSLLNSVLSIIHEYHTIKEKLNAHLIETADTVIKRVLFDLGMNDGIIHLITLDERARATFTPKEESK